MLKGFAFFLEQGWKHDEKYILWLFLLQIVHAITPISSALLIKLVIDELSELGRVGYLALYVLFFAGWICISEILSSFLTKDCFTHRCRVDAAFGFEMHQKLAMADYERLESPEFIDMQAKAKKFLTCDYHGFGYLLDCGASIFGQVITIASLLAILSTIRSWFVLLFAVLAVAASLIESKAIQKAMKLSMEVVKHSRLWVYYGELFEQPKCGKEIRMNGMMHWLLGKEREVIEKAIDNIARQNGFYIESGVKRAALSFLQNGIAYGVLI